MILFVNAYFRKMLFFTTWLLLCSNVFARHEASEASNDIKQQQSCVRSLRSLFEASRDAEILPTTTRKEGLQIVEQSKIEAKRKEIAVLGGLIVRNEYFEPINVDVKGSTLTVYKLVKPEKLREDLLDLATELRKLIKADQPKGDSDREGYSFLLKEFLEYFENHSPNWFDKKVTRYESFLSSEKSTLFDLMDVLVVDYAHEHGVFTKVRDWGVRPAMGWMLHALGFSESTRQFWVNRIKMRYANSAVDQTVALPIKIPEMLITGLIAAYVTSYFFEQQSKKVAIVDLKKNQKSRIEELRKIIFQLEDTLDSFEVLVSDVPTATEEALTQKQIWNVKRDEFLEIAKVFAKLSSVSDRLTMDQATKEVVDHFIAEIRKNEFLFVTPEANSVRVSEDLALGFDAAELLFVSAIKSGHDPSKDDLKEITSIVVDYKVFNKQFLVDSRRFMAQLMASLDEVERLTGF